MDYEILIRLPDHDAPAEDSGKANFSVVLLTTEAPTCGVDFWAPQNGFALVIAQPF